MKKVIFYYLLCNVISISICDGYRILGVFPFSAKSHNIVFEALMKGLAKHGHQVDVATHFPLKKPMKNYNDIISFEGDMESLMNNYTMEFVSQITDGITELIAESYGNRLCHFLGSEKMQKLIKNPPKDPPYDAVITESFGASCFFGLGYVFKVPVIAVSSAIEYPWVSHYTGNDDNLAYVPNAFHVGTKGMNFYERFKNVVSDFIESRRFHFLTGQSQTESMRKYLDPNIPDIREVEKKVALILINNNPTIFGIKPVTPGFVQISGLHIEGNEQVLSPELKKWMDESTNGVVLFTLGSMVLIETLPENQLREIYEVFEEISPVRVIMKITNSTKLPSGLPQNVKILPWIPQQSILAHPNTKIFITHGGLGGLQEALHFGVPMIGIPLFSDQSRNVAAFESKEIMIRIKFDKLSKASLGSSLKSILQNPVYKEKAMYYSKLFRDRPLSPMQNAIFWIEYVIRNGPDVLRSPSLQLSYWQLQKLDVYGSIFIALMIILITIIFSIKFLINISFKKSESLNSKKKKS